MIVNIYKSVIIVLGVEIRYEMYNPLLQNIEVLKLEKRLDDELFYLRDCPAEYSTIPFDMEPIHLPKGSVVPLNKIKVFLITELLETFHFIYELISDHKKQELKKPFTITTGVVLYFHNPPLGITLTIVHKYGCKPLSTQ